MSAVITRRAEELVTRHALEPPIAVIDVAERLGARVDFHDLEDQVSGLLVRKGDQSFIVVNASHAETRQRFTIAHEVGHLLLHKATPGVFLDGMFVQFREDASRNRFDRREVQANMFAASLLMPERFLREELDGTPIDISDDDAIRGIAQRYKVSAQALTIRLVNLGLVAGYAGL
jgi:Zn-dependent peptidase ImmA (M78 family)